MEAVDDGAPPLEQLSGSFFGAGHQGFLVFVQDEDAHGNASEEGARKGLVTEPCGSLPSTMLTIGLQGESVSWRPRAVSATRPSSGPD
jgi:hypothetical protein